MVEEQLGAWPLVQWVCYRLYPFRICSEDLSEKSCRGTPSAVSLSLQVCSSASYSCRSNPRHCLVCFGANRDIDKRSQRDSSLT